MVKGHGLWSHLLSMRRLTAINFAEVAFIKPSIIPFTWRLALVKDKS